MGKSSFEVGKDSSRPYLIINDPQGKSELLPACTAGMNVEKLAEFLNDVSRQKRDGNLDWVNACGYLRHQTTEFFDKTNY